MAGTNPATALYKVFVGSFGSWYGFKETVTKTIPLLLTGTGLVIAFRARFWNIGAEGQVLFGAIGATWVALKVAPSLPLMFLGGFIAGGLWGLLCAWLRTRYGINEVISSLMLNYIAAELVQYLIYGPWKGKSQFGMPYTDDFPASATLPCLYGSRVHYPTLILALLAMGAAWVFLRRTTWGFEIRVVGENPDAARYAGIQSGRTFALVMLLSGGLAGLAGVGEVAGIHHHLTYPWAISSNVGYTAIIVAWLARLEPPLVLLSGLFFGGILVGGDVIQTSLGLPFAAVNVFNAVILLFLIMGDFFREHRVRWQGGVA